MQYDWMFFLGGSLAVEPNRNVVLSFTLGNYVIYSISGCFSGGARLWDQIKTLPWGLRQGFVYFSTNSVDVSRAVLSLWSPT